MAESDRYDVLISIAYTLMSTQLGLTREQLRSRVDDYRAEPNEATFERRFERDKVALRNLGFILRDGTGRRLDSIQPEEAEDSFSPFWDLRRRYKIDPKDYALPALRFTTLEAALLGLASQVLDGGALGRDAAAAAARLGVDGASAAVGYVPHVQADDARLADLLRFVGTDAPLTFKYVDADGKESKRVVVPWGLGHRSGHWYLAAGDVHRNGERLFRVDRIQGTISRDMSKEGLELGAAYGRTDRFDMTTALERLTPLRNEHVAVVVASGVSGGAVAARAIDTERTESGWRFRVGYTQPEELVPELAGEGLNVEAPGQLATRLVTHLRRAGEAQSAPPPAYRLRRHGGGRVSVEAKVGQALDVLSYVCERQDRFPAHRVPMQELLSHFGLKASQLGDILNRLMTCGVAGGLHDELLDVQVDETGVRIENAQAFGAPKNLSPAEVASVLVGLNALAAAPLGTLSPETRRAVAALTERLKDLRRDEFGDFERIVAIRAATGSGSDVAQVLSSAIGDSRTVQLRYAGAAGTTQRVVEPVQLLEAGSMLYLRAWCRLRQAARLFRLDRIVSATAGETYIPASAHRAAALDMPMTPDEHGFEADVIFRGDWIRDADRYGAELSTQLKGSSTGMVARIDVLDLSHMVSLVAASAGQVTVAGPEPVREAVLDGLKERLAAAQTTAAQCGHALDEAVE